jgi:carbon-monoxide dehydrogenase medium subunit
MSHVLLRPRTLEEAQGILLQSPQASVLAGGQSLVPAWRSSGLPAMVLSLDRIDSLRGVRVDQANLQIGAGTTLHELATSALVRRHLPALADMAAQMGDRLMRYRATAAGAICATNGVGCLPAAILGCHAVVQTTDRTIPAAQWFAQAEPAKLLQSRELVVRLDIPIPLAASHQCLRLTPARFAAVTVFATLGATGFAVGASGLGKRSVRLVRAAHWLATGDFRDNAGLQWVFDDLRPNDPPEDTADYRIFQAARLLRSAAHVLTRAPSPTFDY